MLLPTKNLHEEKSLIKIGGRIIKFLEKPKTVSRIWNEYTCHQNENDLPTVTFDRFILAIDFLYMIGAIELDRGRLRRAQQ